MIHSDIAEKIIACAYTVYNQMGFGYLESVYEKCMLLELIDAGLKAESQQPIKVFYRGRIVGDFVADIIVNNTVIVELKSVSKIIQTHEIQLVNYLVATNKPVGLILNFAKDAVEVKRKIKDL